MVTLHTVHEATSGHASEELDLNEQDDASLSSVKSAERVLRIIEFLAKRRNPTPAMIICYECDIPKSSAYSLLRVMCDRRFVAYHHNDHAWTLGARLYELGGNAPLLAHALAIFRAFERGTHHLDASEISKRSELPSTTVARLLPVLEENRLLTRSDDERYGLGLQLVSLASRVGDLQRLRIVAHPTMTELRNATGETANLVVLDNDRALYIDQVESRQLLRFTGWVGHHVPLDKSASGAALSGAIGPQIARDTVADGVTAIACLIEGTDDPCAAISLTGPSFRLERNILERAVVAVERAAKLIEASLTRGP